MKKRTTVCFLLFSIALLGSGCDDETSPGLDDQRVLIIDPDADAGRLLDTVSVDSAWVTVDSLHLDVSYGGGCETHDFRAFAPSSFAQSNPPELPVYLRHDGHADACRAIIRETIAFDVTPAADLYRGNLGLDGWFRLAVTWPNSPSSTSTVKVLFHSGIGSTPRADSEAEETALLLSGELTAPEALYEGVLGDVAEIRRQYGDQVTAFSRPLSNVTFWLPWVASEITVDFEPEYVDKVAQGLYTDWDALNAALGLESIDTRLIQFGTALLGFGGILHPCRLVDLYRDLPGVNRVSSNVIDGDAPNIFPFETDSGRTYVFREAWGDCPAGCINQEYWYFVRSDTGMSLVGKYDPQKDVTPPSWWSEADLNLQFYNLQWACP
jgi:hypothetical protein